MISHYEFRLMPEFAGEVITDDSPFWRIWRIGDDDTGIHADTFERPLFGHADENLTRKQASERTNELNAELDEHKVY